MSDTPVAAASPARGWKRIVPWILPLPRREGQSLLLWLVTRILFWYVVIVIVLGLFQRSLIYYPLRQSDLAPAAAGLPSGRVHAIRVTTHDGLELHGWHILAQGYTAADSAEAGRQLAAGRPLVLYFSGNAGNRSYRTPEFEIFTAAGADVFVFDYRGYGENPGSPSEEALAADARTIWEYAAGERGVDPGRIVLFGESLGSGVATRLAARVCDAGTPPAGLLMRAPFSSLADVGAWHFFWLPVRLVLLDRFPSIDYVPRVTAPILIIHGSRDQIVPIELGRKLFDAAPDQSADGIPRRFVELRGADHNDVLFAARDEYRETVEEFFELVHPTDQHTRPRPSEP